MGKIYKRYTHNGNFVKEEIENSLSSGRDSEFEEQNSLVEGTEIVTGNKDPVQKKQHTEHTDIVPNTFQEHLKSIIQHDVTDETPQNNTNEPTPDANKPPSTPPRRKETYEEQASKLGFKDLPANLAHSLISWTRSGRPVVTAEQWNTRLSVCRECQFWSENKTTNHAKCMKCGCGSGKLLLTQSKCPLNPPKWTSL